jgi:hypothetical protein
VAGLLTFVIRAVQFIIRRRSLHLNVSGAHLSKSQPARSKTVSPDLSLGQQRDAIVRSKTHALSRLTLIRKIYRMLLNSGRSYAAFTPKHQSLLEPLLGKKEILDPMGGYGMLTRYCAEAGIRSYCVEYNLPQYLWQILSHPAYAVSYFEAAKSLLANSRSWPNTKLRAVVSDEWFPDESRELLLRVFHQTLLVVQTTFLKASSKAHRELAIGLLLPFVGRLSCSVPGDIVTHTKKGGICVFVDWEDDFRFYLSAVMNHLEGIVKRSRCTQHKVVLGDARNVKLPQDRFSALLNSPPYPNHRDFVSMFAPEHDFLDFLEISGSVTSRRAAIDVIGSNFVADRPTRSPTTQAAKRFFKQVAAQERNETAIRHDKQYYFPYFEHYFRDLEEAYENIVPALKSDFEGYIVVVNNTHRNVIVPVSDAVLQVWKNLGFQARIFDSNEYFHVGTKNPLARGLRAKHTEYVIKVWR